MACWICVTNRANFEVVKGKGIWGVTDRYSNKIAEVKSGDTLIFYLMQERSESGDILPTAIGGAFVAKSKVFKDSKKIFKGEVYPNRIRVEPLIVPNTPVLFKPLVQKLSFIKNKQYWSGYFRRAMLKIPERDCKLILGALEKA